MKTITIFRHFSCLFISAFLLHPMMSEAQNGNPFGYPVVPDTISASTDAVGSPAGQFAVSPMGAATYSVGIEAPVGLPGAQPQMGIAYNSQSGNGVVGYGCNISGISVITRSMRNIYYDSVAVGINYTIDDAFYLDGQRLLRLSLSENGDSAIYCLESDPYVRIVAKGVTAQNSSGLWFYLTTRDGIRHEYGTVATAVRSANNDNCQYADAWYLTRSVWPTGNYIDYGYTKDQLYVYPSYVQYGQNLSLSNPLVNRIDFSYENRNDIQYFRVHGNEGRMQKRLHEITTTTGDSIYRKYTLSYDGYADGTSTKFSRLVTINENNGRNESVKPVNLSWENLQAYNPSVQPIGFDISQTENNYISHVQLSESQLYAVDINCDGISDIIQKTKVNTLQNNSDVERSAIYTYLAHRTANGGLSYSFYNNTIFPADVDLPKWNNWTDGPLVCDFNGDGKSDLVVPCVVAGSGVQFFYLEDFRSYNNAYPPAFIYRPQNNNYVPLYTCCDFNKDGRSEVVVLERGTSNSRYYLCIYKGAASIELTDTIMVGLQLPGMPEKILTADYNSDGLSDLLIVCADGYKIYWNQGGAVNSGMFQEDNYIVDYYFGNAYRTFPGDFNGDGLTDYLATCEGNGQWMFSFGNGDGTFSHSMAWSSSWVYKKNGASENDGRNFTCLIYDMDGDGKSDVFISKARYNYGNDFAAVNTVWLRSNGVSLEEKHALTSTQPDNSSVGYYMVGDFNGDGLPELANYGYDCYNGGNRDNVTRVYYNQNFTEKTGKITTITNGFGNTVGIEYSSLPDSQLYEIDNNATYPVVDCTPSIHVVARVFKNAGTVYADTTDYSYGSLKYNVTGKGLLGFMKSTQTNRNLSTRHEKQIEFNTNNYTPTRIYEDNIVWDGNGQLWSENNITDYSYIQPHQGLRSYCSYPTSSHVIDLDGNEFSKTYTYDPTKENALTEECVTHDDGYRKTTYSNFILRLGHYRPINVATETKYTDQSAFTERTHFAYNLKGQLTNKTERYSTDFPIVYTFTYDSFGNVLTEKKAISGNQIYKNYTYDPTHRFVTLLKEMGDQKTYYTHDIWGNVLTATDKTRPNYPLETTYTYDGWGRVKSELAPSGRLTTYIRGWSIDGGSFVVTQGTGTPWQKDSFDQLGRKIVSQSISFLDLPIKETYGYDLRGELKKHYRYEGEWPDGIYSYELNDYDTRGRLTRKQLSGQPDVTYTYAPNMTTTTQGQSSVEKRYNLWGDVVQVTDNAGTVSYEYGSHGHPVSTSFGGHTVTMDYDAVGRQRSLTDPDAGTTTYTYGGLDKIVSETDAQGHVTTNTYNAKNLLTSTETDGIVTTHTYGTTSNNRYQLLSSVRGNCSVSYTYDSLGRVASEVRKVTGGDTLETHYTYNNIGQLTTKQYVGGPTISYTYDAYGYTDEVWADSFFISKPNEREGYLTSIQIGENMLKDVWYDLYGRLEELNLYGGNITDPGYDLVYYYDDDTGNIEERAGMFTDNEFFSYDALDRLTGVERYNSEDQTVYAPNGNITYKTGIGHYFYESVKPHAVTMVENTDNRISHNIQYAAYNAFGKIDTLIERGTYHQMTFVYGPDNERWSNMFNRNPLSVRRTYYMGDCEKTVQRGHTRRLYYLDNGAIFVRQDNAPDSVYFMFTDHLGSIVSIVDYEGNELFKASYDAWGNQTIDHNDIDYYRGYTGHEMMPEFGLINMNGRLYDPQLGRFLSTDNYVQEPFNSQNFNRYSYCLNNPLKYSDPSGEIWWLPIAIGAAVGMYSGGVLANEGQYNPFKWDYNLQTIGYMFSGAIVGSTSSCLGGAVTTSGIPMANTLGLATSSLTNSIGTWGLTGGLTPITMSLGVFSYDFTDGSFGYFGKGGNSEWENVCYFLESLAMVSDFLMGTNPEGVDLVTEHSDLSGHTAIVQEGTETDGMENLGNLASDPNALISVGSEGKNSFWAKGTNHWRSYSKPVYINESEHKKIWRQNVKVNMKKLNNYSKALNNLEKEGKLIYSLPFSTCAAHACYALNYSGVINFGLHPYLLNAQIWLWNNGIRPWTFLYQGRNLNR